MEKTAKAVPAGDWEKSRSDIETNAADSAWETCVCVCVCPREEDMATDYLKTPPFGSPRGLRHILSAGGGALSIEVLCPKTNEFGTEGRR